ncbi:hypothetical protein EHS19_06490 [Bifidobacterium jacchi]|uniref:NlpC/P60 domain-containing protein n=2 Tax=Bifidobacterium jacchi TaxID=2490545 RepID=A0A5N5RHL6_9BIFI|nr:hypothetical protein EHS19_06490 [Bifidobacterium jacchi]
MRLSKTMMSAFTATVAAGMLFAVAPMAHAAESSSGLSAVRSFPAYSQVRKDFIGEHTSTEVESDSNWGGIEDLNVPRTKSSAEKQEEAARAAAKKAEEERRKAEEAERALEESQHLAVASQTAQAASRSEERKALTEFVYEDGDVTSGAGAAIGEAYSLIGQSMDCTMLVSRALAAAGINFHGWPEQYVNVPGGVEVTDGSLKPGDILIYRYTGGYNGGAHWDHVALYVGNGKAIHGGFNGGTVALAGVNVSTGGPDKVVRVFH